MNSIFLSLLLACCTWSDTEGVQSELIFPLNSQHNHAPGIVECPNGDLLVSWYRGSVNGKPMMWWYLVRDKKQAIEHGRKSF